MPIAEQLKRWASDLSEKDVFESGFVLSSYRAKVKWFFVLALTASVYLFAYATYRFSQTLNDPREVKISAIKGYTELCGASMCFLLALYAAIVAKLPSLCRIMCFELVTLVFSLCCICALIIHNTHYLAVLLGYDPNELSIPRMTDTTTVLAFGNFVSVGQYISPIRWRMQAISCGSTAVVYGVAAYLMGSPESPFNRGHQVGLLAIQCFFSAVVCRQSEMKDRRAFATMVQERRKRVSAEFQLYEHAQRQPKPPQGTESVNESLPTTTDTGLLFQDFASSSSDALSKLIELGQREHWLIRTDDVCASTRCIGRGGFAAVFAGSMLGSPVALKMVHADRTHLRACDGNELRILRLLRHPNIVLWHGACVDVSAKSLALVFELIEGTTLSQAILGESQPLLDEQDCDRIILDIARAVRYLHGQRPTVVHGDLTATNVMVEAMKAHYRAKLVDFGLSRLVTRAARPLGGTVRWMAPELFTDEDVQPNAACDVFSFGRLMYTIITKQIPLAGLSGENITTLERLGTPVQLVWPLDVAYHPANVARKCLNRSPTKRLEMGEVLNMIAAPPAPERPSSVADEYPSGKGRLLNPSLQETPLNTRLFMVRELVRSWNVQVGSCCQYHSQLQVLINDCVRLRCSTCSDDVVLSACSQCSNCLALLAEENAACDTCGHSSGSGDDESCDPSSLPNGNGLCQRGGGSGRASPASV